MSNHGESTDLRRRRGKRLFVGSLVLATLGAVAAVVLLLAWPDDGSSPHRPAGAATASAARLADPAEMSSYLAAASADVQTVTTLDYHRLDDALGAGSAVTTGAYRTAFRAALTGAEAQRRMRNRVVQSFEPLRSGLGEVTGDRAKVLVFGVQHSTSTTGDASTLTTLTATVQRMQHRYLISALDEDANAGVPPGSDGLRQAAEAARREVVDVLSFRRSTFAADERRALGGASGVLRAQLAEHAAATEEAMARGDYDLSGAVTAVAVETVESDKVRMLIAASGLRTDDGNGKTVVLDARYEVEVTRSGDKWLVTSISPITA